MRVSLGSIHPGQGTVEIDGTTRVAERSFTSPLTEQECVAYRLEKEGHLKAHTADTGERRRSRETWQRIHVEEAGAPFYVENGGERVLVDGSTADLDMEQSYVVETSDFEDGVTDKLLATVTGSGSETPEEEREVADEYVEEITTANNPRRYKEWVIPVGESVTVRGEAVAPEQTPIGSSLDAGADGPTEPVSGGLTGSLKGLLGIAENVPVDPRARYKPRAIERLPDSEVDNGSDDPQVEEVHHTVSLFEGVTQGRLAENPDALQRMMAETKTMTDEELRIADEAMPDAPGLDRARVVISWGQGSEFVVSDST